MTTDQEALPYSQACENNKPFILEVLRRHLGEIKQVLEIGSGTGQHAEAFAAALPHLAWQPTDLAENLPGLNRRITQAKLANLGTAIELDVSWPQWPCDPVPAVFSANSLHIMPESAVSAFFLGIGRCLAAEGLLLVYDPFRYRGQFTTESNAVFDQWLKARDPVSGIRDFEWIDQLARGQGLTLLEDNSMPANNQLLVWRRTAAGRD